MVLGDHSSGISRLFSHDMSLEHSRGTGKGDGLPLLGCKGDHLFLAALDGFLFLSL
jgi:hypothetical protein